MKRKLFKKVLLTLTMLFGLNGVVNAQVNPKVEAQVKEQSAKELKLIKDYLKLEDTGLEKLEEILVDKNLYLLNHDFNVNRTRYTLKHDHLFGISRFFIDNKMSDKYERLVRNYELLKIINLNVVDEN